MGILMMILATLGGLAGAVAVGLLKDEVAAWFPALIRLIIRTAVEKVPLEQRERYEEEWSAHVLEYPGKLSQTFQALLCLRGARQMEEFSEEYALIKIRNAANFIFISAFVGPFISLYPQNYWWFDHVITFLNFIMLVGSMWSAYWLIKFKSTITGKSNRP